MMVAVIVTALHKRKKEELGVCLSTVRDTLLTCFQVEQTVCDLFVPSLYIPIVANIKYIR
jgi:hypothetical protein